MQNLNEMAKNFPVYQLMNNAYLVLYGTMRHHHVYQLLKFVLQNKNEIAIHFPTYQFPINLKQAKTQMTLDMVQYILQNL